MSADQPNATDDRGEATPGPKAEPEPKPGGKAEPDAAPPAPPEAPGATESGAEAETPDTWGKFAPVAEREPGRVRRGLAAFGRSFVHEWTLAAVGAVLLAVVMTWPTLRYPAYTIPHDIWDPTLVAWMMSWSGHILTTDPSQLWHGNGFYPHRYSYAFTDTLLGYAPAGMVGDGPQAALVRYNIIYVLLHALAFFGAYALVRQLGAGRTGAAVAGAAFAYAPWRLAQAGHIHVISTGGMALALAMLARGHGWSLRHGYRPERRHAGWAVAGWLVAAWQLSLGFGVGLPFAYILATITVVALVTWWVRRRRRGKRPFGVRLLLADLFGGVVFATTGVLLSLPYFRVVELHPYAKRTVEELKLYSVPLNGFFVAPEQSRIWGSLHADARAGLPWHPEMTLLAGFVLYALAMAGLLLSIWTVRQRLLLLAGVVLTAVLAMGTRFFGGEYGYLLLYNNLPGFEALRTPGRFVIWTTLLLGILAAGAVDVFVRRAHETRREPAVAYRLGFWLRLATLAPLLLVLVEGINATPHPVVPTQPEAMRTAPAPMLVLPSSSLMDNNVMLWSTDRFAPIVNGNSGFTPRRLAEVRQVTQGFPDRDSVGYLRELGVRTVILLPERAVGTPWQDAANRPIDLLGITREDVGDAVVYRLSG